VVKATFNALQALRSAKEIADLRGISVSKVFNG
jgi:ribosomal protein S5